MAVEYTQYINGVRTQVSEPSGATPSENEYKVHRITSGNVTTVHPNYIDAIKSVGTDRQWTNVNIVNLDGTTINGLTIEEADKVRGPFRSVAISLSQVSGSATSSNPSLIIWEKLV